MEEYVLEQETAVLVCRCTAVTKQICIGVIGGMFARHSGVRNGHAGGSVGHFSKNIAEPQIAWGRRRVCWYDRRGGRYDIAGEQEQEK